MSSPKKFNAFCLLPAACLLLTPLSWAAVPDGYVVKLESATVYLDWGKASGVVVGDQFKVYKNGAALKHPVTGEILGHERVNLGSGVIERVDDKFSSGTMFGSHAAIETGNRTEWVSSTPVAGLSKAVAAAFENAPPSRMGPVPKEMWRSEPISHEAVGLAIGDVDGDSKKEVAVAYHDQVEVFKWDGKALASLAVFKSRSYSNYLTVETADVDGAGHDKIFASLYIEGIKRAKTIVLEYSGGTLKEVGHLSGFVRVVEHMDGKRVLMNQDLSLSRELRVRQPETVVKKDNKWTTGPVMKLARSLNDDQLFGYTWGDWDADGVEDFAFLQRGERLRLLLDNAKWSAGDIYGGTKADFSWEDDQVGSVYNRLANLKTAAGKPQLLVPHNIPATPIRLARLKIYKEAELVDLGWNGLEMAPVWRIPVAGLLADFGAGDVTGAGAPQIWIAAVGTGDKTILLGYSLP